MRSFQFSMKAIGVSLVLLVLFCLSFSVSSHHQNLLISVYDFLVVSNSEPGLGDLLVLFCLLFSVSSHHQNLLISLYDFLVVSNSEPGRFAFFVVFNFIAVIISLGSSKTSEADFEESFSQTSFPYECNATTIDMDEKFHCSNNVDDNEHQGYDKSDQDDENHDTENDMEQRAEEFIAKMRQKWIEERLTDRLLCITHQL